MVLPDTTQATEGAIPAGRLGRPRDPQRDRAIIDATLELLASNGYDRLSMETVAARAGVGKATVYRRWSSKAALVIDAVRHIKGTPQLPDTGSLRADLDQIVASVCSQQGTFHMQVMCGITSALGRDAELLQAFQDSITQPRIDAIREVLERAGERGELPQYLDLDMVASVLPSMTLRQVLLTGKPPSTDYAAGIVRGVLGPLLGIPPLPTDNVKLATSKDAPE